MKLSIIIPIYNVEPFIDQCLSSVYAQQVFEDRFEVIAVNDGTPDKSMDIVKRYAEQHDNLTIINQANLGLSVARNTGLRHAKGDYIWFVDSDDWLTFDSLRVVLGAIEVEPEVEVFATILNMFLETTGAVWVEYKPNFEVRSGRDYMFRNHNANRGACQRYIFKKFFLQKHDLKFMPGVYHEDGEFSNRMLYLAERLIILPQPVYYYRLRTSGSIMSSRKMKMNYDLVKIYHVLKGFADKKVKGNDDYWLYREKIYQCLVSTVYFSRNEIFTKEFDKYYQENKRLIKNEARKLLPHLKKYSLSENFTLLQFAFFPKLTTQVKQGIKRFLIIIGLFKMR